MKRENIVKIISSLLEREASKMSGSSCMGYFYQPEKPMMDAEKVTMNKERETK